MARKHTMFSSNRSNKASRLPGTSKVLAAVAAAVGVVPKNSDHAFGSR